MLTKKQVTEIREHLERAQNPIFFFDNDPDGLCSFLLLQRFIGRGKGVAIKSFPGLNAEYFRKVNEMNGDYIFILDKPVVSEEFFDEARNFNIPIVWIDHHKIEETKVPDFVDYYNSALGRNAKAEPVTYLCYETTKRREDLWLAVIGCISDRFVPKFYKDFAKLYPELSVKSKDAFEILFSSQIGTLIKIFAFGLKDSTTNVVKMIKFLIKAKNPYDVLEETKENKEMYAKFNFVVKKYNKFLEKAKALADSNKILFFQYGGDLGISTDLSNELSYLYPDKIIVVAYLTGARANISIRGEKIKKYVLDAIKNLESATGGGHENAVGARVKIEDIEKFRENLEKELNNKLFKL